MTARHHFYGQLRVDDIADLPDYVASHASGGGAPTNLGAWNENTAYPDSGGVTYQGNYWIGNGKAAPDLTLTSTANSITATWGKASDTYWQVYLTKDSDPWPTVTTLAQAQAGGPATSFKASSYGVVTETFTSLTAGRLYLVRARSVNSSPTDTNVAVYGAWQVAAIRLAGDPAQTSDTTRRSSEPPYGWTNLSGPAGAAGPRGFRGPGLVTGHGAPTTETWNGDVYLDLDTGDVYQQSNVSYQDVQSQALAFRGPWQANTPYQAWDVITNAGSSYFVTASFTSGATFATTNLVVLALAGSKGGLGDPGPAGVDGKFVPKSWTVGDTYAVNDLVLRDDATWRVSRNHTAATWNDPTFGPLINYLNNPSPTSVSGLTSLSKSASTDATKSVSASGFAARLDASSEVPMTNVTGYYPLNAAQSDTARLRGKTCLFRVHVYSTESRTFRIMVGADTTATEPPPAGNTASNPVTVAANTITPITMVATMPFTTDLSLTVLGTTGNTTSTMSTWFSGWQVSELPTTYPADGSNVPYVEGYTSSWAGSTAASPSILRSVQPLTPTIPVAPLRVEPRGALSINATAGVYSATRTYSPGECVYTRDGSVWQAIDYVPLSTPPTRYNWVTNPNLITDDAGWIPSITLNTAAQGGTATVTRVTAASGAPNLSGTMAMNAFKPAGTQSASLPYYFMDIPLSTPPGSPLPGNVVTGTRQVSGSLRVWTDTAIVLQSNLMTISATTTGYSAGTFTQQTAIAANTWTTLNNATASPLSMIIVANYLRLVSSLPGTTAVNLQVQTPIVDDFYGDYSGPRTYFDGASTQAGYTTGWRRTANASPSVAVAHSYWRLLSPGNLRNASPVQASRIMQDIELHSNAGSRTMGY